MSYVLIRPLFSSQAIRKSAGDGLKNGRIGENQIDILSICPDVNITEDAYIHIGSLVSRSYPARFSKDTPYRLVAGVVDRVLDLRSRQPKLTTIIATDFADVFGDRHFGAILPRYGFCQTAITPDGDPVYIVNLEQGSRPFEALVDAVAIKQLNHLQSKRELMHFARLVLSIEVIASRILKVLSPRSELATNIHKVIDNEHSED
jgi:hypothetical protein